MKLLGIHILTEKQLTSQTIKAIKAAKTKAAKERQDLNHRIFKGLSQYSENGRNSNGQCL